MKHLSTKMRLSVVSALTYLAFSASASADPTAVAKFKDWTVFTASVDGQRVCYAATEATDRAPTTADHGDVWFYVTNWASGRVRSQPSLKVGYELRADLAPSARIGRADWTLFSSGNEAFAADEDDPQLVRALKRGSELRVEAVSARDTQVAYHFSLAGSSAAIDRAASSCR